MRLKTTTMFLHGLDSSSQGTKGRYFQENFPGMICPDFNGDLDHRLAQLEGICEVQSHLTLIGSSFGGLMATCFTIAHPQVVNRLILLAPALNFNDFHPPATKSNTSTFLIMGNNDTVCPPELVEPLAKATFNNLDIRRGNDDHLLRRMFQEIDWQRILLDEEIR